MKILKLINFCLLVIAALLLVTAVVEFVNGNIIHGIYNIFWMELEVLFFLSNKHSIEIKQENLDVYGFLFAIDNTIEKYGAAIITEKEDGIWKITAGFAVEHDNPSCSAKNNDQIEFTHISDNDKN